jgi:methyl-accepting chemotaxis protein
MFANNDGEVTYLNEAIVEYLGNKSSIIKKNVPDFDIHKLIGKNVSSLVKDIDFKNLNSIIKTSIKLGDENFDIIAYPVFDRNGDKLGSGIEWLDETISDYSGQAHAVERGQAVIHFDLKGNILHANENFLATMGYSANEVVGKHHSMFAPSNFASKPEYKKMWDDLGRGEFLAGEFNRIGKNGKEVWINASYNPIMDLNGKPYKIVKYATDVTQDIISRLETERGVEECVDILTKFSSGNLNETMTGEYEGEFSQIKSAINNTIDNLKDMVSRIVSSANVVASASSEIADSSMDLSGRTEQQASNLEETSASMEEMTSSVRENSENANKASELSKGTMLIANKGGEAVRGTVDSIKSIADSSKKISDIIGVIDEIAFQTNLLALNAAVEAARAGDAGKGFAVVADEVRTLAGRSAQASKEIKDLIVDSVEKVKSGVTVAEGAGKSIEDILKSVNELTDLVNNIAIATNEQTSGIEQVNTAISSLDEMTQQNAAMVEESTASAEAMNRQAKEMQEIMRFFKIDGNASLSVGSSSKKVASNILIDDRGAKSISGNHASKSKTSNAVSSSDDDGWEEF